MHWDKIFRGINGSLNKYDDLFSPLNSFGTGLEKMANLTANLGLDSKLFDTHNPLSDTLGKLNNINADIINSYKLDNILATENANLKLINSYDKISNYLGISEQVANLASSLSAPLSKINGRVLTRLDEKSNPVYPFNI